MWLEEFTVKTMAKGTQKRRAHNRDGGDGDRMSVILKRNWLIKDLERESRIWWGKMQMLSGLSCVKGNKQDLTA